MKRLFRGINRLLPVKYRGEADEKYWEAYVLFAATDDDEAARIFDEMCEMGCEGDGDDHVCHHFRFGSLRPLSDE